MKTAEDARTIEAAVATSLNAYIDDLQGAQPSQLHALMIERVEKVLFQVVLARTSGNQLKAAQWLGLNRNTLRKKLREIDLNEGQP